MEYAPRAGTTTARWWGNDIGAGKVNCNGCGSKWDNRLFADVDSFAPNPFGLYYGCSAIPGSGPPIAGTQISAARRGRMDRGGLRQARLGGSWSNLPNFVRSAARSGSGRNSGEYDYLSLTGFRVARGLP